MKTTSLFLACAAFACSCSDVQPKTTTEQPVISTYSNINTDSIAHVADSIAEAKAKLAEQAKNIGKTFIVNDATLQNIAISGKILAYKDGIASGELVLTDKTTKKVIQKLPFLLNNEWSTVEKCVRADDFDFDGNMDIVVEDGADEEEVSPNIYAVYLYNTATQEFEKNKDLSNTVSSGDNYEILFYKKTLVMFRKGGSIENYYDIFKIENKKACQIQWITESYRDNGTVEVSVLPTKCDGKSIESAEKTYKHKPYPNNYKGEGYYKKYIE